MKVEQTPSPGIVYLFGLETFARAVSYQLNAVLVWHIHDGRVATQPSSCVHLPLNFPWVQKLPPRPLSAAPQACSNRARRKHLKLLQLGAPFNHRQENAPLRHTWDNPHIEETISVDALATAKAFVIPRQTLGFQTPVARLQASVATTR